MFFEGKTSPHGFIYIYYIKVLPLDDDDDDDDDDDGDYVSQRRHFFVTFDFEVDGCRTLRSLFFGDRMCELLSQQNPTVSSVNYSQTTR